MLKKENQELCSEALEVRVMLASAVTPILLDADAMPVNFLEQVGETNYFVAAKDGQGVGIWKTDGTPTNTELAADMYSGPASFATYLTEFQGNLLFSQNSDWFQTDGTQAGSQLLATASTGAFSQTVVAGNLAYAWRYDSIAQDFFIWVTDGTPQGTTRLSLPFNSQGSFKVVNDVLYICESASNIVSATARIWTTDGTDAGTRVVATAPGRSFNYPVSFANDLFFFSSNGTVEQPSVALRRLDVDLEQISDVITIQVPNFAFVESAVLNDRLYFFMNSSTTGQELFVTDGTALGTQVVKEIRPGPLGSEPKNLTIVNRGALQLLAFDATDGTGHRIWTSDGTEAGTVSVSQNLGSLTLDKELRVIDGGLAFLTDDGFHDFELWICDLTPGGVAERLTDFYSYPNPNSVISGIESTGDSIYVSVLRRGNSQNQTVDRFDLWRFSDFDFENPVVDFVIAENTVNGTSIGFEPSSFLSNRTFSIVSGNLNDAFAIDSITGDITVNDSVALNYESNGFFDLIVSATRTLPSFESVDLFLRIEVANVNDAPTMSDFNFSVDENAINGTIVDYVYGADQDEGDPLTYTIVSGNLGNAFGIHPTGGNVFVNNATFLDFESTPVFNLQVRVTDEAGAVGTATVTIDLSNMNDAPTVSDYNFSVDENAAVGTTVGNIIATDQDAGDTLTYFIEPENFAHPFEIGPTTGVLQINGTQTLDFETLPLYYLHIRVTDLAGDSSTSTVAIALNDVIEGVDPVTVIDDVIMAIDEFLALGDLSKGQANPIRNLLNQALVFIANNRVAKAVAKLRAAVTRVTSLVNDGSLTSAEGLPLIDWLEAAIDELLLV